MTDSTQPLLVVTGDVVHDCHLYAGVKTAASAFPEPATRYQPTPGGAAFTHAVLVAAAQGAWAVELGVALPSEARTSYAVWTPRALRKGSKERVWRIERDLGYGPTPGAAAKLERGKLRGEPVLTVLDEGGLGFRHGSARAAWPEWSRSSQYLVKLSSPLGHSDLWAELAGVRERTIVVVQAADLRREDAHIGRGLSWEKTTEDTLAVLAGHPFGRELRRAAHVIVSFQSEGALWARCTGGEVVGARLFFSPSEQEGDHARAIDGSACGIGSCFSAGVADALMRAHVQRSATQPSPFGDPSAMASALGRGILSGLSARRRVLELGHGPVGTVEPRFPMAALAASFDKGGAGFESVEVPLDALGAGRWTILQHAEGAASAATPLVGLATLTARHGQSALSHLPALSIGAVFSVDRDETESLRTLESLVRRYEATPVQKKPLSIGIFGPPGAGKSFAVKALAKAVLGDEAPFLEFNLSQFKDPGDVVGAFHRVRDAVLLGTTPVAFWDEFDSQRLRWLQYLLAPMQDGVFQEGQLTHPIGKCIFVFAGGTSHSFESFAPAQDHPEHRDFQLLKGPDFLSRLHGHLDVLGPNARAGGAWSDVTWPIRRALFLRTQLGFVKERANDVLDADPGLLHALLAVPRYTHGARSFEKIVQALAPSRAEHPSGRLQRSWLPSTPMLARDTDPGELLRLMHARDAFINHPNIDALAKAEHDHYRAECTKRGRVEPENDFEFAELSADAQTSNREAARRIPGHLALIDCQLEPSTDGDDRAWVEPLRAFLERHLERLAQAEHLGWCEERRAAGMTHADTTDKANKLHASLVDWSALSEADRARDRDAIRAIPEVLYRARYRAVAAK